MRDRIQHLSGNDDEDVSPIDKEIPHANEDSWPAHLAPWEYQCDSCGGTIKFGELFAHEALHTPSKLSASSFLKAGLSRSF